MHNESFKKDLYRYFGDSEPTLRQKIFLSPEIKYIKLLRKIQGKAPKILKKYYKFRITLLSHKTGIQIPWGTQIGEGFYIGHCGMIVINSFAKIGKNVNIAAGVTIGQESRGKREGYPTISDNVWIGTNAVIVGNVTIGSDVLIAPLTFVNFDVPEHSIVLGNPGKIIPKENATEGYIISTV